MKHLKFAKQPKEQAKIQRKQILNKGSKKASYSSKKLSTRFLSPV